ncbi:ATP-binding protein [Aquibacillus sediminis]|uniref:ATP-binding protein n=1 Tax=Aquibacillus sediminis TaxID=2574734 RepID=UPI001486BCCD|nr:ATP-binding protein [Aquibacillus sediminis]
MKLRKLQLKNFRGYEELEVDFNENLNVIIGKNDVGKSTILDALNIFFNDVKPDLTDCNKYSTEKVIEIGVTFEMGEDELVILDASNPTSLRDEYLLNNEGYLEVKKIINAGGKSITQNSISVLIKALHPNLFDKPLITYSQSDLKNLLKDHEDEIDTFDSINKTKKADMRQAIFDSLINDKTIFKETTLDIKDTQDESFKNWLKLKENLPLFNLFQSDRNNTDGDREVQDPMKAITKEVLADLQEELDSIRDQVVERVEEVGRKTIDKLKDFNGEIAKELKTIPDLKTWDSLFKFNLDTDNEIPLNKRGSGIRRLILLSYFRAQAEQAALEKGNKNVIYAIEEPETSQHPNYQHMIIDSLTAIAQKENSQVFITTHTPEIAQIVDENSLIMISKDEYGYPAIVSDRDVKVRSIVDTLGILPTIHSSVVVCVEGPNDVLFIRNINKHIPELREIIDLENSDISIYNLGGSRLIDWINLNHFEHSNTKEFHLYDGDIQKYKKAVDNMNSEQDGRRSGTVTKLREMENYIPRKIIEEYFKCDLSQYESNWSEIDIPNTLKGIAFKHISNESEREKAIKRVLNGSIVKNITAEDLREHGVFQEVKGWFEEIKMIYDTTASLSPQS